MHFWLIGNAWCNSKDDLPLYLNELLQSALELKRDCSCGSPFLF